MKKITLKKLLFLNNVVIIDIREKDEFLNHCIPNSINIPFFKLYQNYAKYINKDIKYYIVCEKGYRSRKMVKFLNKLGYDTIYIKNGLKYLHKFYF